MKIIENIKELVTAIKRWQSNRKTIGFVPTMGALHEGHLSLIKAARKECERVVVSIFVNPMQFGPEEDFSQYPRDLKKDKRLLKLEKTNLLFIPKTEEIYPEDFNTKVIVDEKLTNTLCGINRPEHFAGVSTMVTKLLILVRPQVVYFGQKDYQQVLVIRRIIKDLNLGCKLEMLPTSRETDGLAKSSRNTYLSSEERQAAANIYKALKLAESMLQVGERNPKEVIEAVRKTLRVESSIEIEYIATKNAETLEDLNVLAGKVLVALAVKLGKARLIDNIIVEVPSGSV